MNSTLTSKKKLKNYLFRDGSLYNTNVRNFQISISPNTDEWRGNGKFSLLPIFLLTPKPSPISFQTKHFQVTLRSTRESTTATPSMPAQWHHTNIHKFSVIIITQPTTPTTIPQRRRELTERLQLRFHSPRTTDRKAIIIRKTITISEASADVTTVLIEVGNEAAAIGQHSTVEKTKISSGPMKISIMPAKTLRVTQQCPSQKDLMKVRRETLQRHEICCFAIFLFLL